MTKYLLIVTMVVVASLSASIILAIVTASVLALPDDTASDIGNAVGLLLGISLLRKISDTRVKLFPNNWADYKVVIGYFLFGILVLIITDLSFAYFLDLTPSTTYGQLSHGDNYIFLLISTLLLQPVVEELFFRGYLYSYCKENIGIEAAVCITTLLFFLGHGANSLHMLSSLVLIFCLEKTGFLLTSILIHVAWNGYVYLFNYLSF